MARKTNTSHLTPEDKILSLKQENERLRHIIGVQKEEYIEFKKQSSARVDNLEALNTNLFSEKDDLIEQTKKLNKKIALLKKDNDFLTSRNFFQRLFNVKPK